MFDHLYPELGVITRTIGYKKLTHKQQQMIRLSFVFQKRVNSIEHKLPDYMADIYYGLNCHKSVLMLETGEYTGHMDNNEIPLVFFSANYSRQKITRCCDVHSLLSKIEPPIVVHISTVPSKIQNHYPVLHTMLVLEVTQNKDLVIWEKEGTLLPFRIANISDQLSEYNGYYWGYRKLRSNS